MILFAATTLTASAGSVGAAYCLSHRKNLQAIQPQVEEQVKIMFPETSTLMPTFQRVVESRAKAKIRPMSRKEVRLMKQYTKSVHSLAEASLGHVNERNVRAAGAVCWKLLNASKSLYNPYDLRYAREVYNQMTALEKGRMSDEYGYIQHLSNFAHSVFKVHAKRFMDSSYRQRLNVAGFHDTFSTIVKNQTTAVIE